MDNANRQKVTCVTAVRPHRATSCLREASGVLIAPNQPLVAICEFRFLHSKESEQRVVSCVHLRIWPNKKLLCTN